jgi:nitroimidazol reductase NimA-like FMN-containing flavoprotein (pyridoxamine 5'-phosphate oxidase superfamily)
MSAAASGDEATDTAAIERRKSMDPTMERSILALMKRHNVLTLATIRPDGWPQATTVAYANEGLTLYVMVDKTSQKAKNIRKCEKVSLTIDRDYKDWDRIKGLSMAARAEVIRGAQAKRRAARVLADKFPEMAQWASGKALASVAILKLSPTVISVLDYSKGFGHADLVKV